MLQKNSKLINLGCTSIDNFNTMFFENIKVRNIKIIEYLLNE